MNYTELVDRVQTTTTNTFDTTDMNTFIDQAEQKIYNSVQLPDLRKNSTGAMTADNKYLTLPTDYLYTHAFAVISAAGRYSYPLVKDASFMREVYPTPTVTGMPKHYAHFSEDVYILGPTPDAAYAVELHYGFYPETIVTATNTWLGDNFDAPLFNGVLLEAMRFMKGEADVIANYEKLYLQSITLLKNYSDGKLRQDNYRSGQVRIPVT